MRKDFEACGYRTVGQFIITLHTLGRGARVSLMGSSTARHHWTEQDDIVALYFYKFGHLGLTSNLAIVGERRGMGGGSLRMRVGNFRAIAGGGRLDHAALQSRAIYQRYGNLSEPELRKLAGL